MLFSKRAQLTPFIIVGIVIITIFGFVFFATGQVQQAQSEQQAEKIASEIVQTTPLRFYVNLCTEKALRSAVDILGKQGGKVFPSQNGSIMKRNEKAFLYKEADTTYFVGYGILNNNVPLPQYPCKLGFTNYDLPPAYCEYISTNTKFNRLDLGMPNLPELCKDARSGCSISEQGFNPQFSVQAELEGYVSAYVKDCVDFESIIGINQTYDVTEGDVFTNISMSDKSISANVNFPLVIAVQGTQPVIQFISFESTTQTRFKLLYGLVKSALKREVSSSTAPGFKFTQGFLELAQEQLGNNHGFVITKRENVSFYDDFIQIIDTQSDPTQQLVFQFVVENRPPILNYIDPRAKTKTDCGDFDYIAIQDKPITLPISWFDTEEDGVTISVFGWLEEYNETNIVPEEFTGCPIPIVQKKIFNDIPLQRRWKTTDDGTNAKTLSTQLFADDIGPHQFVVQVCDAQYCDNQTVRVLVDDLIKVTVDKKNEYGGGIFSTEDPFTFTAKIQDIYNPGAYKFSWVIRNALGADVFTDETEGTELKIPTSTYSIINIHKAFQSNPLFELGKKYTVVGKVVQAGQFESENKTDIIPQACVSYTSVTSPRSFPYNTSDPYLSTHACCAADNTLKPTSATCFTETTYGTFKSFNLNQYQTAYDALLPSDKVNGVNPTSSKIFTGFSTALGSDPIATLKSATVVSDNSNDIIQRSFERKCDGTRGNICVGNFVEIFKIVASCDNKKAGEIATCEGPDKAYFQLNSEATLQPICKSFDKTTLEKELGFTTDIRCNQAPKCVTNPNSVAGFTDALIQQEISGGKLKSWSCNATCGSNGCAQTLPTLCHNCLEDQKCVGPTLNTPTQKNTVQLDTFNQCQDASNPMCQTTHSTLTDTCKTGTNTILIDYSCKTVAQIATTNVIHNSNEINCAELYEKDAEESDTGDNPTVDTYCRQYQQSVCRNPSGVDLGMCTDISSDYSDVSDGVVFNAASAPSDRKYVLREYYASNTFGNSKKETCISKDYDLDQLYSVLVSKGMSASAAETKAQTACQIAKDSTNAPGIWQSATKTCCHDDYLNDPDCPSP